MKFYYRISDNSYQKDKLIGADKFTCLANFLECFDKKDITIIADRCHQETLEHIKNLELKLIETNFGNAGSLHFAMDKAIEECSDTDSVYFCEDDYLHLPKSQQLIKEGLSVSDYITLYDHPDKYTSFYEMGETSKVIRTNTSHWRYTISTCMTFGTKISILKDDIKIFKKHVGTVEGENEHPIDHDVFCELKEKRRKLAVCIPGSACHIDLTFSILSGVILLESWAIELMIKKKIEEIEMIEKKIKKEEINEFLAVKNVILQKIGWQKLISLEALIKNCN